MASSSSPNSKSPHNKATSNAQKLIDDVIQFSSNRKTLLDPLPPQQPPKSTRFDDMQDSDFESEDEDADEEEEEQKPQHKPQEKVLAGTKRKNSEDESPKSTKAEVKKSTSPPPPEKRQRIEQTPSPERKRNSEVASNKAASWRSRHSSPSPSPNSDVGSNMKTSSSHPNVTLPTAAISPVVSDPISSSDQNGHYSNGHGSSTPLSSTSAAKKKFSSIHENARKMKKTAERMLKKPHEDPSNIHSYAMSLRAGLMFMESAMVKSESGDLESAIKILHDMIKYFEYFASSLLKSFPKLHIIA
jgi:hypothetical protein